MPEMKVLVPTLLALTLFPSLFGCRHTVAVRSDPVGASLHHGRTNLGNTPTEVVLWKAPFVQYRVRVGYPGHRAVEVDLARGLTPWTPRRQHEVVLVAEHGPAGTWEAEQAGE